MYHYGINNKNRLIFYIFAGIIIIVLLNPVKRVLANSIMDNSKSAFTSISGNLCLLFNTNMLIIHIFSYYIWKLFEFDLMILNKY
jgi:hypothetical protein